MIVTPKGLCARPNVVRSRSTSDLGQSASGWWKGTTSTLFPSGSNHRYLKGCNLEQRNIEAGYWYLTLAASFTSLIDHLELDVLHVVIHVMAWLHSLTPY